MTITRRTWTVTLGLILGWMAAGIMLSWDAPTKAASDQHQAAEPGDASSEARGAEYAAEQLYIGSGPDKTNWYGWVLYGALVLFAGAVVIGPTAVRLRGPVPPDPADEHHDH